jgi:TPP-dependent pyruvate/acetoin dehydrogenase alpha subunit
MVEVMAGVALAFRLRMEPRAAILVDTADSSASGYWHEGLNLAAVQRAPLVLVIDGARRQALTAVVDRLAARAPAYGIRAVTVEGDDPHLVLEAVADAAARARLGEGTQLVEVVPGSSEDPVDRLIRLEPSRSATIEEMRALALGEAREAAQAASAAPPPDASDARYPVLVPSPSENYP